MDINAVPECDAVFDFRGGVFWLRIIPGGIFVVHAVNDQMIVVSSSLPWADGGVLARLQKFFFYRFCGKILVAFDNHAVVTLRNHFSAPACFCHSVFANPMRNSKRAGSAKSGTCCTLFDARDCSLDPYMILAKLSVNIFIAPELHRAPGVHFCSLLLSCSPSSTLMLGVT